MTVGTYGVVDYNAAGVVAVVYNRAGVVDTFQQGRFPSGRSLTTMGVDLSLRSIAPPTRSLTAIGVKPALIDPGHPT